MSAEKVFGDELTDKEFVILSLLNKPRTPKDVFYTARSLEFSMQSRTALYLTFNHMREKGLIERVDPVPGADARMRWFLRTEHGTSLFLRRWKLLAALNAHAVED